METRPITESRTSVMCRRSKMPETLSFAKITKLGSPESTRPEAANGGFMCRANMSARSEEHTSELQSLMRISYAVFCLKKKIDTLSDRLHIIVIIISTKTASERATHITNTRAHRLMKHTNRT